MKTKRLISLSLSILLFFVFASPAQAWLFNRKKRQERDREESRQIRAENEGQQQNIIFPGLFGYGKRGDGADDRRVADGDKSKNQGYSAYKRWAAGIMISVYAVPYQDGNQYTGVEGISGFIEHNISEFFTLGITHINQKFSHLDDVYSDEEISHKHTAVYAGVRRWITNRSVVFARYGIADSKVEYTNEEYKGQTEFMSVGLEYALDESDSSRIGYRYISLAGKDKSATRNIGMSLHGITFQVLF